MKKTILLTLSVMLCFSLMAQPKPNSFFAGGSFRFYTEKDKSKGGGLTIENYNRTSFNINPAAGYFLSDKFAVGARLGLGAQTSKYPNNTYNTKQTQSQFSFAPFARYYFINQKFGVFGEGSMGIGFGKNKSFYTTSPTDETKTSYLSLGVSPGIYYSVSDHLMIESTIGWFGFSSQKYKYSDDTSDIYNDFSFDFSTTEISLGFSWIF